MKNFIIFFTEKEGTTPLVRLLDQFEQISMLHQDNHKTWQAWEPFDAQECGPMPLSSMEQCLNMIFDAKPIDFAQLNQVYTATATHPLKPVAQNTAVGFKMRFIPAENPLRRENAPTANKLTHKLFRNLKAKPFKQMMFKLLKQHQVTVLFAVRQDLLRWGLSKYHGDGSGKSGHLQFSLAMGKIDKKDIGKMTVDCKQLEKIINRCEKTHRQRQALMAEMKAAGIDVYPVCYEDFLNDKPQYFKQITQHLELDIDANTIEQVLQNEEYFKKVHSNDIADIVENHQQVMDVIGERFFSWS